MAGRSISQRRLLRFFTAQWCHEVRAVPDVADCSVLAATRTFVRSVDPSSGQSDVVAVRGDLGVVVVHVRDDDDFSDYAVLDAGRVRVLVRHVRTLTITMPDPPAPPSVLPAPPPPPVLTVPALPVVRFPAPPPPVPPLPPVVPPAAA